MEEILGLRQEGDAGEAETVKARRRTVAGHLGLTVARSHCGANACVLVLKRCRDALCAIGVVKHVRLVRDLEPKVAGVQVKVAKGAGNGLSVSLGAADPFRAGSVEASVVKNAGGGKKAEGNR